MTSNFLLQAQRVIQTGVCLFALTSASQAQAPGASDSTIDENQNDDKKTNPKVLSVMIKNSSETSYAAYHGEVVIGIPNQKGPRGPRLYRWGGTECPGKSLSAANVNLLVRALGNGFSIEPNYKDATTSGLCLVSFQVLSE